MITSTVPGPSREQGSREQVESQGFGNFKTRPRKTSRIVVSFTVRNLCVVMNTKANEKT